MVAEVIKEAKNATRRRFLVCRPGVSARSFGSVSQLLLAGCGVAVGRFGMQESGSGRGINIFFGGGFGGLGIFL